MIEVMPITEDLFLSCMEEGWKVTIDSLATGMKPLLGGGPLEHALGKMGESLVVQYLKSKGWIVETLCFSEDYRRVPESYDIKVWRN